ncbi:MAG: 50S ribosomal protein L30 [Alphaproteobacteria bacterium]|nr:50S ribosomal protein L30 [Alphaproteobacteria bacterium]
MKAASKRITVQQHGSAIRRHSTQLENLKSLGLGKIGAQRELEDTASIRGLIRKVQHMVRIVSE